jgi:endogenous inhibitor of DNA gyrase (YacG/DUF329 family)
LTERPANENERAQHTPACAVCAKPVVERFRPFCSKRCADVDLQRWLTNSYVIPGERGAPGDADVDET